LGLRRDLRLRRRADFDSVYKRGRIFNDPLLVLRTLPNNLPHNRYGFVTSKRLGGAVVRNRVRRRLQEIVMASQGWPAAADSPRGEPGQDGGPDPRSQDASPRGYDLVLSAKAATVGATFQELTASVRRLYAKGGLLAEPDAQGEAGS
jgi:ribonuclease P protein component